MKRRVLEFLVLASSLAFMNCSDEAADKLAGALSDLNQPTTDPVTGLPFCQTTVDPVTGLSVEQAPVDSVTGVQVCAPMSVATDSASSASEVNPASSTSEANPVSSANAENCPADSAVPCEPSQPASSASTVVPASFGDVATSSPSGVESSGTTAVASSSGVAPVPESSTSVASSESKVESSSAAEVPVQTTKIFLASGTEEEKDLMEVEYKEDIGYGAKGNGILAYPKPLSTTQKHGIVIWGPGGGTEPGAYEGMIRRLASHGFVVFALDESPGDGENAKKALDFLAKKNETQGDELFGKLDMNVVGCSGHSMGGLESEQAAIKDSRVQTAFLNNSGDLGHVAAASVSTSKSIAILYGEGGMERPNAVADYKNEGVKAPACLLKMQGGEGTECANDDWNRQMECGWGHGSGSWGGKAATVSWMRWHLGGEDFRKDDFVGASGKYVNGNILGERGSWKTECKNF